MIFSGFMDDALSLEARDTEGFDSTAVELHLQLIRERNDRTSQAERPIVKLKPERDDLVADRACDRSVQIALAIEIL